ncbi:MAG: type I-B CRISPR-associated protein Cas5b [Candidatus Cryosericum sp.]
MESIQTETALVVDVWSDYAHFRKPYTTSSPLTFAFPPRTALAGLVAAFIGLGKDEYLEHFTRDKASLAVALGGSAAGVVKTRIPENFIDTKDSGSFKMVKIKNHTQINVEVVYAPRYRIFIQHQESEVYTALKNNFAQHHSVYTPYLGISEFIAGYSFVGEFPCSPVQRLSGPIPIASVVPIDHVKPGSIVFEAGTSGNEYLKERMPGEMLPGRVTTSYDDILYERHGNPILAEPLDASTIAIQRPVTIMWL